VALSDDLTRIAAAAAGFAGAGEDVAAVLPAEPHDDARIYLCAFEGGSERRWLALTDQASPVESRALVRDAVSIAALCEIADETAAGGDLDELSARLVALRMTEAPLGIEEAEDALRGLQQAIGAPPRVASPAHLDRVGLATRRLEQALGEGASPFAEAMKLATESVERLADEVEANYKGELR
jgi:hypothetical protein